METNYGISFANNKLKEKNLSSGGISNFEIEKVIKTSDNEHLKNNFIGVFPSNHIRKFENVCKVLLKKKAKYVFLIWNAGRSEKPGTHWASINNLHNKKAIFLFDSFGIIGLKNFIIQNDEKIVRKVIHGIKKLTKTENKITVVRKFFPGTACNVLEEKEISNWVIQLRI